MNIEDYEHRIKLFARRFGSSFKEIEDFEQIGRMAAFKFLSQKPNASFSEVITAIKRDMIDYLRKLLGSRRKGFLKIFYINKNNLLRDKEKEIDYTFFQESFKTEEEKVEEIIEAMKKMYGHHYISGLKKESRPYRRAKKIIRAVLEDIYCIEPKNLYEKVDRYFFNSNPLLKGIISTYFNNSYINALSQVYGEDFVIWNLKQKPNGFWKGKKGFENAKDAVRWFIKKNNIQSPEDCKKYGFKDFEKARLGGMLQVCFKHSPYLAFKTYFPNLKPWNSKRVPSNYFDDIDNQKEAIKFYLIEKGFPPIEDMDSEEFYSLFLKFYLKIEDIRNKGLASLLRRHRNSIYHTFKELFPEKVLPWTFNSKEPWKKNPLEIAAQSIRWLFEDYLKASYDEIPKIATTTLFWRVGFSGIMTNKRIGFNSSPYKALNAAYPRRYSYSELIKRPRKNIEYFFIDD